MIGSPLKRPAQENVSEQRLMAKYLAVKKLLLLHVRKYMCAALCLIISQAENDVIKYSLSHVLSYEQYINNCTYKNCLYVTGDKQLTTGPVRLIVAVLTAGHTE